jgi:hypothetical protein
MSGFEDDGQRSKLDVVDADARCYDLSKRTAWSEVCSAKAC